MFFWGIHVIFNSILLKLSNKFFIEVLKNVWNKKSHEDIEEWVDGKIEFQESLKKSSIDSMEKCLIIFLEEPLEVWLIVFTLKIHSSRIDLEIPPEFLQEFFYTFFRSSSSYSSEVPLELHR